MDKYHHGISPILFLKAGVSFRYLGFCYKFVSCRQQDQYLIQNSPAGEGGFLCESVFRQAAFSDEGRGYQGQVNTEKVIALS